MKRMKQLKKVMALILAMVMVLAMGSLTAFAESKLSITITNTNESISIDGKTYNAYKLFDSTHIGDAYAYTMSTSSQFYNAELVSEETAPQGSLAELLRTYFTFTAVSGDTSKVNVEPKDGFDEVQARIFADAIQGFLDDKISTASAVATDETAVISLDGDGAGTGYYIVTGEAAPTDSTSTEKVVSAVIITNENPSADISPKAGIPTLDKKITAVKEGQSVVADAVLDDAGKAAVAKVGSIVSYELDSIVPDLTGYSDYTFTFGDTITEGLDYDKESFVLTIDGTPVTDIEPAFGADDKSFTLTIPYSTLSQYDAGDKIVLTYNAVVNADSLNYDYVKNTADLTYSNDPYSDTTNKTPEKETYVVNINIAVNKVAGSESGEKLANAEFILYRNSGSDEKEYYKWDETKNVVTWTTETDADKFTTDDQGKLTQPIRGLDKGTYYLVETKAPAGYNLLKDPIEIIINVTEEDGQVIYTSNEATITNGTINLADVQNSNQPVATITVINQSGTELPSTGGTGTTIFYILGSILVIGAGILLITKKRMSTRNS